MPDLELEDVVWFQMMLGEISTEVMGRYVHDPGNVQSLKDALGDCLTRLREVQALIPGCRPGWEHEESCRCRPIT